MKNKKTNLLKYFRGLIPLGIFFFFLPSISGQTNYHWTPILNGPPSPLEVVGIYADNSILGFLSRKNQLVLSQDEGQSWEVIDFTLPEDFYTSEFAFWGNQGYLIGPHTIHEINADTKTVRLVQSSNFSLRNLHLDEQYLYYRRSRELVKQNRSTLEVEATFDAGGLNFSAYQRQDGTFYLISRDNETLEILDADLQSIQAPMPYEHFRDMHFFPSDGHLYRAYQDTLYKSEDQGDSWESVYVSEALWSSFRYAQDKLYLLHQNQIEVFHLPNLAVETSYTATDVTNFYTNGSMLILVDWELNAAIATGPNMVTPIKVSEDAPDTRSVTPLYGDLAYFRTWNQAFLVRNNEWTKVPPYNGFYVDQDQNIIATQGDIIYFSSDGGQSFSGLQTHPMETGIIRKDPVTKDLYIFNELHFLRSADEGLTWERESVTNYLSHFTVHLSNLNHIYPIDEVFYSLSKTANVLKLQFGSGRLHADMPWNGDQRYKAFVINSETDAFVLFHEAFGAGDAVMMRKLVDGNEEVVSIPIRGEDLEIDATGRLYLHDDNRIFLSEDKGDSWIEITGNLPSEVRITKVGFSQEHQVYLSSSHTDPYKLDITTSLTEVSPTERYQATTALIIRDVLPDLQCDGYQLLDLNGQVLISEEGKNIQLHQQNIQFLSKGYYVLTYQQDGQRQIQRLLKL